MMKGRYFFCGELKVEKSYVGIDVGGMTVKGMLCGADGKIFATDSVATDSQRGGDALCANIASLFQRLLQSVGGDSSSCVGIGVGCPGLIDSENGVVVFAGNLNLENYPLAEKLSALTGKAVKVTNDANAAALGEAKFGSGKRFKNSILVTLGTGVGGGIVVDGKLFEGGHSAGAEIGHTVIVAGGKQCTCGRKGCFERYASARALTEQTREAMAADPSSAMWKTYDLETVTGKTAFEYADVDNAARGVVGRYVRYLACGIVNLVNVFRPEAVMLGGGVSGQGERLTVPLQQAVDEEIFAGTAFAPVKIVGASLGNRAGAYGAAALWMPQTE